MLNVILIPTEVAQQHLERLAAVLAARKKKHDREATAKNLLGILHKLERELRDRDRVRRQYIGNDAVGKAYPPPLYDLLERYTTSDMPYREALVAISDLKEGYVSTFRLMGIHIPESNVSKA